MVICAVICILSSLSTLCIKEYRHVQRALIEAVRILCHSMCVICEGLVVSKPSMSNLKRLKHTKLVEFASCC